MKPVWIFVLLIVAFLVYYRRFISLQYSILKTKKENKVTYQYENYSKKSIAPLWYEQKIPFKIHQTSFSKKMDYKLSSASLSNHYMNPEYDYYFYDDTACVKFLTENYPQYMKHYDALVPGAYKADLFRLLILYKEGGVYIDDKTFSVRPLRELILPDDELLMIKDNLQGEIYQGVLFSVPGHFLIKKFIDRYISNIESRYYGVDPYDIGGPKMFGRVLNTYLNRREDSVITSFESDGVRVTGGTSYLSNQKGTDVILSDDKKTIYFERGNSAYLSRKVMQMLKGKEYHSLWMLGKVYK